MKHMRKWRTLASETVFEARPYIRVVKEKVEVSSDHVVDDFFQVHLRPFVACVPVLPNGNVLMLRQYKHGPRRITLTFPGGFVEEGECIDAACKRELLEETGYKSQFLTLMGSFVDNGNQRGCEGNFYLAQSCSHDRAPASGDLEEMELLELRPGQVDAALLGGDICLTHHAAAWLLAKEWLSKNESN